MTTPTFRITMNVPGFRYTDAAWPTKHAGRPSDATLARYVADFEASCAGGCNEHLGAQVVRRASVIRQATGDVVASYEQPMFAVI